MRVLHIDAGKLFGGVETLLVTLARCRDLCPGMEPEFAVCFEGRLSADLRAAAVPVHVLGEVRVRRPDSIWRARRRLKHLLDTRNFDAVICHMAWPQAIFGPVVQSARLPLVFWLHNATDGRHWLERWASRTRPDLAICNSRFTAGTLRNVYPGLPAETMYYPVAPSRADDDGARRDVRAELSTAADAAVIVMVSRLEQWKGHRLLLEALGLLRTMSNWSCWIAGGPQRPHEDRYLEDLKRASGRLAIGDRVRFLGQRSDVPRLLRAADIFCQPNSGPEPFGIVFVEALYAGLPLVTTAMGGGLEIVDDTCGILVEAGDAVALSKALAELVSNREKREYLAQHAPVRAEFLCDSGRQLARLRSALETVLPSSAALYEVPEQEAITQ
jgi:glycosyltransferase involved in cell wall biosynthesis